jgi:methionyl-tRNA formyltransferase
VRVALFASGGEIPVHALRTLTRHSSVVAIVRPRAPLGIRGIARGIARRLLKRAPEPDELSILAKELGVPEWYAQSPGDPSLVSRLRTASLDLACIATFPWPLPDEIIGGPRLGTVNLHPSLLPRHRGPNPWFWTYHADDREVGVTLHASEPRVDRGAILVQDRWPLARGQPVGTLHREVAERGAALLPKILSRFAAGDTAAVPQEEARATRAPRVRSGTPMLDLSWPTERAWHFLAGLAGQHQEPLRCCGAPVRYRSVPEYEEVAGGMAPGLVEREEGRGLWRLWCTDGYVRLRADQPRPHP